MKLQSLGINASCVDDLSPLRGMPLDQAFLHNTPVKDLSPLSACPLKSLYVSGTIVADLQPIRDLPIEDILVDPVDGPYNPAHLKVLRSMPTLKTINHKPAADFWKAIDAPEKPKPGG
jgi:hypothetical protein